MKKSKELLYKTGKIKEKDKLKNISSTKVQVKASDLKDYIIEKLKNTKQSNDILSYFSFDTCGFRGELPPLHCSTGGHVRVYRVNADVLPKIIC